MRKISEIRRDLSAKVEAVKAFDPAKDAEAIKKAAAELEALNEELRGAQAYELAQQNLADKTFEELQKKAGRAFSLVKFLNEAATKSLSGLEADVAKMGAEEYARLGLTAKGYVLPSAFLRSAGQNAGTDADGGYAKSQMPVRYIDGLKDRLVIAKMGATVLGDLVGTVPVVSAGAISAAWKAEGATTSVSKATFAKVALTPHRASIVAAFSRDLLAQTSLDVEAIMLNKVMDAHATLVDKAAIAGSGSNNEPTGILGNANVPVVAGGTNGAAISWAKVVKLESTVNSNNGNRGKLGYLTNAKVMGDLKTTERANGNGRYLLDGDFKQINGYPIDWTNLVPANLTKGTSSVCSAMIFGNFEDLYIGAWGGLDVIVDPYTLAADGDVRIVLNAYNDVAVVEPKAFAVIKDITTDI